MAFYERTDWPQSRHKIYYLEGCPVILVFSQSQVDLSRFGAYKSLLTDLDVSGEGLKGVLLVLDDLDGLEIVLSFLYGRHLIFTVLEARLPSISHAAVRFVDLVRNWVLCRHHLGNLIQTKRNFVKRHQHKLSS